MNVEAFVNAIPEIVTQLLGFVIVFIILKKYAFGAMFKVMDERRGTIQKSFDEIEAKKAELDKLESDYRSRLQHIEQEARTKIQEAVQEGQRVAKEIREKAAADSLQQVERAKADIEREIQKARAVLREQMVSLTVQMAEKVIARKLSAKEDEAYVRGVLKEAETQKV